MKGKNRRESGQGIVGRYRVRAKGYEQWEEPKVMAGMYSGTRAEGTYVSARGRVCTQICLRRWAQSALEGGVVRGWRSATIWV